MQIWHTNLVHRTPSLNYHFLAKEKRLIFETSHLGSWSPNLFLNFNYWGQYLLQAAPKGFGIPQSLLSARCPFLAPTT